MEYQASPADEGHVVHAEHAFRASVARFVDSAIASLQRLRNRIEPPVEEEDSAKGRHRKTAENVPITAEPVAAASDSPRLRRFLVLLLVLAVGAILGMTFSYRLLSHAINGKEAAVDALRDEIGQLEKENAHSAADKAKYQKQANENDKEIRALQREIEDYRGEIETLRNQAAATKVIRIPRASNEAAARPIPQKSGTCTTGSANTATDLARCVETFNRR